MAIDAGGVGPVGLHRDRGEALVLQEAARQARALTVELVGAVRGLADEDDARVADQVQQAVVILARAA